DDDLAAAESAVRRLEVGERSRPQLGRLERGEEPRVATDDGDRSGARLPGPEREPEGSEREHGEDEDPEDHARLAIERPQPEEDELAERARHAAHYALLRR